MNETQDMRVSATIHLLQCIKSGMIIIWYILEKHTSNYSNETENLQFKATQGLMWNIPSAQHTSWHFKNKPFAAGICSQKWLNIISFKYWRANGSLKLGPFSRISYSNEKLTIMTVQNDLTLVGYQSTTATLKCVKHIYKTQENCGATTQRMEKKWGKL
jgi:hypothetical protein